MAPLTLVFRSPGDYRSVGDHAEKWRGALAAVLPEVNFLPWQEVTDPAAVDAALCWLPPEGWLASMPNL